MRSIRIHCSLAMKCCFHQNLLGKLLHQLHARIDSVHFKTRHQVLPVQSLAGILNFRPGIAVSLMIWIGLQCRHLHQKTSNSALTAQSRCRCGARRADVFMIVLNVNNLFRPALDRALQCRSESFNTVGRTN